MKIVSDFDGVLTDLAEEAHRVGEIYREMMVRASELPRSQIDQFFERGLQVMRSEPLSHGWKIKGRVSAYFDEDYFILNNGLGACFDELSEAKDPVARAMLNAIKKGGFESFMDMASRAYNEMTRETSAGKMKPLDSDTATVLKLLIAQGHEVVVVSNSKTDRIVEMFATVGLQTSDQLRVRGNAQKFMLGDNPALFQFGSHAIDADRPLYRAILSEEKPGAVIGDVFSLDLGLPFQMAQEAASPLKGIQLFLRKRPYTPIWTLKSISETRNSNAKTHAIERLPELLNYLK